LSLPSLRRTVLFLTRSGMPFQTLFFTDVATVSQNSGAQHVSYLLKHCVDIRDLKNEAHCLGSVSNVFWIKWYKALSNCGYSLKNSIVRPTNIATFWPAKDSLFCVTHNDCRRQPLLFKQVRTFLAPPNLTAAPKRLVWIRHWFVYMFSGKCISISPRFSAYLERNDILLFSLLVLLILEVIYFSRFVFSFL